MKMLHPAALVLLALLCAPAMADPVHLPQVTNAGNASVPSVGAVCVNVDGTACTDGLPPALSTPLEADVTPSGVAVAQTCTINNVPAQPCGAASFAGGTAIMGPFGPQLGRDLRVVIRPTTPGGSFQGQVAIGTSSAANACAPGTINPLTVGGQAWGSYTAAANEVVDTPTLANVVYCATVTITSGSARVLVRQ